MTESKLSSAEAELYDRQIRLWGIESQEKLRAANVLLVNIRGLGSEIAKDLLLSGINSLTILDEGTVSPVDLLKNFLLKRDSVGEKIAEAVLQKAQDLNPLVKITTDTGALDKKDEKYFAQFTIVIATCLTRAQILKISKYCRDHKVKFICGDNFGMFGFSLADFQEHTFFEDKVKFAAPKRAHDGTVQKGEKIVEKVSATVEYPDLSKVITLPETSQKAKRRNVYYYVMLALLEFREKHSRDPAISSKEKDLGELKEIIYKVLDLYQVAKEKLDENVLSLLFDEIIPISSIVGGVIAQEVIKAVSGKEVPIHNVFLLDPITYSGREETVGVVKSVSVA